MNKRGHCVKMDSTLQPNKFQCGNRSTDKKPNAVFTRFFHEALLIITRRAMDRMSLLGGWGNKPGPSAQWYTTQLAEGQHPSTEARKGLQDEASEKSKAETVGRSVLLCFALCLFRLRLTIVSKHTRASRNPGRVPTKPFSRGSLRRRRWELGLHRSFYI